MYITYISLLSWGLVVKVLHNTFIFAALSVMIVGQNLFAIAILHVKKTEKNVVISLQMYICYIIMDSYKQIKTIKRIWEESKKTHLFSKLH